MEGPNNLSTAVCNIDRRPDISMREFKEHYYLKKPVILRANSKNKHSRWSKKRLQRQFGDRSVTAGTAFALSVSGRSHFTLSLNDYINQMSSPPNYFNQSEMYVFDRNAREVYPELIDEYEMHPIFNDHTLGVTFSLGRSGTGLPFHIHRDGWLELMSGQKHWFMFPPGKGDPPGGFSASQPALHWFWNFYPNLEPQQLPFECTQVGLSLAHIIFFHLLTKILHH